MRLVTVARNVQELAGRCREWAMPLNGPRDLDPLMERIGDARFVLLGEASHGTSEFYLWRAMLSRRLIEEKGFNFIAVEGDWPDCYRVNRYVKGRSESGVSAHEVLRAYERWPTWMWANWEIVALAEWMRKRNASLPEDEKAGFFGLDVYSLFDSLNAVTEYLERAHPEAVAAARQAYACFQPYHEDAVEYARATAFVPDTCEDEAIFMLAELRRNPPEYSQDGREAYFNAEQNALIVKNAETYYRTMIRGGPHSWNVRDRHMTETLDRLMRFHGPQAKAILWEHNTHIGDARYTNMSDAGMVNVGQLVREGHKAEGVVLVGFGTHRGSVIAGNEWDAPMERMAVPPGREGTWEDTLHCATGGDSLYLFTGEDLPGMFFEPRGHRAIGVVYDPDLERYGNYVPTVLPRRYDAFLFIDETRALHPLHLAPYDRGEPPQTYPWNA